MHTEQAESDLSFEALLRHAAGRSDPNIASAIESSPDLRELADKLSRMVNITRRTEAHGHSSPENRYIRDHGIDDISTEIGPSPAMTLAFDSRAGAGTALRSTATRDVRFMRYEGEYSVELQIRTDKRGTELRGQISPRGSATWGIVAPKGRIEREFSIAEDGTFVVRELQCEEVEIDFGTARIPELAL